jgi:hypothetical protein
MRKESKERRERKRDERESAAARAATESREKQDEEEPNGWGVDGPVSLKWSRADPSDQDGVGLVVKASLELAANRKRKGGQVRGMRGMIDTSKQVPPV